MKTFWIICSIVMVIVPMDVKSGEEVNSGGLFANLIWKVPEIPGEKTETILPPVVKEHHEHTWIKKPHYNVQMAQSFEKLRQDILHKHVTHQKVIHKNHHHNHILNDHTQHNVHTHNLHNQIHHVHEHTKEEQHIHKPILHQYEHHEHKVTNEHVTKNTEHNKVKHEHEHVVTNVQAPPIHEKEWSFLGWLRAWTNW